MKSVPQETDFIVVGAGVAGLRAAIELAQSGRVLVLTKQEITESATQYAQGGIAVALSDEDEISLHLQDTLSAGDGLVNPEARAFSLRKAPIASTNSSLGALSSIVKQPSSPSPVKAPTAAPACCMPTATPPDARSDERFMPKPPP